MGCVLPECAGTTLVCVGTAPDLQYYIRLPILCLPALLRQMYSNCTSVATHGTEYRGGMHCKPCCLLRKHTFPMVTLERVKGPSQPCSIVSQNSNHPHPRPQIQRAGTTRRPREGAQDGQAFNLAGEAHTNIHQYMPPRTHAASHSSFCSSCCQLSNQPWEAAYSWPIVRSMHPLNSSLPADPALEALSECEMPFTNNTVKLHFQACA